MMHLMESENYMNIYLYMTLGLWIPFIGTSAGSACVFLMKKDLNEMVQRALTGFAAGIMTAASI